LIYPARQKNQEWDSPDISNYLAGRRPCRSIHHGPSEKTAVIPGLEAVAKDHYIAQTYLKHFGDSAAGGMLHAHRKADGSNFDCWPKDVCHEWDGDLNSVIADRPELLGDYRKIFEKQWNPSITNILAGQISANDKFVVAAYMANMMVCTPAWRRVAESTMAQHALGTLSFADEMKKKHGVKDEMLAEGLAMIERGAMSLEVDPDHVKALLTRQLLTHACITYNLDWWVVENETDQPFLTSDNPVAMLYSGRPADPVTRILPITPRLCLSVTYDPITATRFSLKDVPRVLKSPPAGRITRAKARPVSVRTANRLVAQCAENLVFSSRPEDEGAADLVKKYGRYRLEAEYVEFPAKDPPGARIQGTIVSVREKAH